MAPCHIANQGGCYGKVQIGFGTMIRLALCKYHGELVNKLQTMTLPELEEIMKIFYPKKNKDQFRHGARILALCSDEQGFQKNVYDVFDGTYNYANH